MNIYSNMMVAKIPTLSFFYPLKENEEILVKIDREKTPHQVYVYV
ncbi:MAG: hypothetical protein R3B93_22765 [Bacteroidia bacterium]